MAKGIAKGKKLSRSKRASAQESKKARPNKPLKKPSKASPARAARAKVAASGARPVLAARLNPQVTLQAQPGGALAAMFNDYSIELGSFSARAIAQAEALRDGLPVAFFAKADALSREVHQLTRRLAMFGLMEFPLTHGDTELFVIEPPTAE